MFTCPTVQHCAKPAKRSRSLCERRKKKSFLLMKTETRQTDTYRGGGGRSGKNNKTEQKAKE